MLARCWVATNGDGAVVPWRACSRARSSNTQVVRGQAVELPLSSVCPVVEGISPAEPSLGDLL